MPSSKFTRIVLGVLLVPAGLVSMALPVLPGVVLLAIGLYLLTVDSKWINAKVGHLRIKYKPFDKAMKKFDRPRD